MVDRFSALLRGACICLLHAAVLVISAVTTWHLRSWRKIYNDGISRLCSGVGDGELRQTHELSDPLLWLNPCGHINTGVYCTKLAGRPWWGSLIRWSCLCCSVPNVAAIKGEYTNFVLSVIWHRYARQTRQAFWWTIDNFLSLLIRE